MIEQTPFIEDVPSHAHDLMQAILGTALSVVLAAGLGAWLFVHQGGAGSATTAAANGRGQVAVAPAQSGGTPSGSAALGDDDSPSGPTSAPRASEIRTLSIVASEAQAAAVRAGIEEANAMRANFGLPPLNDRPVMFDSAEEEATFWLARHEEEQVRGGLGMPDLRIVDMRGQDP